MKRILLVSIATAVLVSVQDGAFAQSRHVTASNLGLGGGGTAYLDSYHANFVNPANLMLNRGGQPRISIGLLGGISTSMGGSLMNTTVYNDYFTKGLNVTGDLADEALDKWFGSDPGNMRRMGAQLDIIPLGASYQGADWAVSAAMRTRVLFDMEMSRGLAELGIYGIDADNFSDPRPVDFSMEGLSFSEISIGYSMKLIELPSLFGVFKNVKIYGGAAPKILIGYSTTRMELASMFQVQGETEDKIDLIRHDFRYTIESTGDMSEQLNDFYQDRTQSEETPDIGNYVDPGEGDYYGNNGFGWGLDLGGTAEAEFTMPFVGHVFKGVERLRVGLSLTDLGVLTFKDNPARFTADDVLEWRGFELDKERIDEEFNGNRDDYFEHILVDSIGTEVYGSFAPEEGVGSLSRHLPTMLNFGAQLTMHRLSVSMDLGKGFIESGVNSSRLSLATGVQYRFFGFLPLRVGMHTGGLASTSYSAGFGLELRNFEFSLSAITVRKSLRHGFNLGAAWSGLVFRF